MLGEERQVPVRGARRRPWVITLLLAGLLLGSAAGSSFPTFVDVQRSRDQQLEAADEAATIVKRGGGASREVLPLLADRSAWVRDRVVSTIVASWSADDLALLALGLREKEPLIVEGVAEIYGRRQLAGAAAPLLAALGRVRDDDTRVILLWALAEIGDQQLVAGVRKLFEREKRSARVRAQSLRTLARLDPTAAIPLLSEALSDRLPAVRIAALGALLPLDPVAALAGVTAGFRETGGRGSRESLAPWRYAALDMLESLENRTALREPLMEVIDALLEHFPESVGRERRDLAATLINLTGVELPPEPFAWQSWWREKRDEWQPPGEGAAAPGGVAEQPGRTGVVRYHGLPVDSERVTFVCDLSGGMARTLAGEWQGKGSTRLDYARKELDRVLRELSPRAFVNLVYFASFFHTFADAPEPLERARPRLLDFNAKQEIPKQRGHNRGNLYDALAFAITRPHVDTIYLLSEGAPTEGKYLDYDRFLDHFRRLHDDHPVRVHVLVMGRTGGRNHDFLQQLAELTGGKLQDLDLRGQK